MTPETRIQTTVEKLGLKDSDKIEKIYQQTLDAFYTRYQHIIMSMLDETAQIALADLIDNHADEAHIEGFLLDALPDLPHIADDALDAFLFEYEDRMGLIA